MAKLPRFYHEFYLDSGDLGKAPLDVHLDRANRSRLSLLERATTFLRHLIAISDSASGGLLAASRRKSRSEPVYGDDTGDFPLFQAAVATRDQG